MNVKSINVYVILLYTLNVYVIVYINYAILYIIVCMLLNTPVCYRVRQYVIVYNCYTSVCVT